MLGTLILIFSLTLWAQEFKDLKLLQSKIATQEIDTYLSKPTKGGLPGDYLLSLIPSRYPPPGKCGDVEDENDTKYEVIFIADYNNSQSTTLSRIDGGMIPLYYKKLPVPLSDSKIISVEEILARTNQLIDSGVTIPYGMYPSLNSDVGRVLVTESLIELGARSDLNEVELVKQMAQTIGAIYVTEEERYRLLSELSSRLYDNYNDPRNPGFNNSSYNPYNRTIPEGDLSAQDLFQAAVERNKYGGGVCNDISEVIAQIGEHLFPKKDVLVVNGGSHFGVLVTDGKTNRIINNFKTVISSGSLSLMEGKASTNLRINKVQDGKLKEIAIVDTQMGQLVEAAFNQNRKLLKTDVDISKALLEFKGKKMGVTVGNGLLKDSSVLVAVAKYETKNDRRHRYIGAGGTFQSYYSGGDMKYQVHLRMGFDRRIFKYTHNQTHVSLTSGASFNGMYNLSGQPYTYPDFSGAINITNKLSANIINKDPNGVNLRSSVEVEHSVGSSSWGDLTGRMSRLEVSDTPGILKNLNLHLNQINVDVMLDKQATDEERVFLQGDYQGSNIGQAMKLRAGLDIKVPTGAEVLFFVGYVRNDLPGFQTKHSLIAAPSGEELGLRYTTKRGAKFEISGRGFTTENPNINGTIKVPMTKKKKK